ncbi:phage/plasmid replication protein, II/X family [Aeromonas veronii]|uniref:phage/plasmid replication protein, II/X family n=1 Tax=Aeromonas veronii TaxID=654 RepID=UPI0015E75D71|nr:phage/plasmid replication protein, II/X family [Aeromonas veronii]
MSRKSSRSLVFCDFLKIGIPIIPGVYTQGGQSCYDGQSGGLRDRLWVLDFARFAALTGISLRARSVMFSDAGQPIFSELIHAFESLPSSHSGIAMVIRQACPQSGLPARVEFQCSPATLVHIQNVISHIHTLEDAAWIILSSSAMALPDVWPYLDVENALVLRVDVTDSLLCDTPTQAMQVFQRMGHVSVQQRRVFTGDTADASVARLSGYDTTRYWGATSELHKEAAYLKGPQLLKKQAEAERSVRKNPTSLVAAESLRVLSDPRLHELAGRMVRLEGRWLKRGLVEHFTRLGLTTDDTPWDGRLTSLIALERAYNDNPESEHPNLISALWDYSWRPLLSALDGAADMDLNDYDAVKEKIFTAHEPRAARPLLQFFRALHQQGWSELRESGEYTRATFNRRVAALRELGFSRAQLQQLDGSTESRIDAGVVIPMQRVLQVGRLTELPKWFTPVDVETWTPFDPSVRRAVGAVVGPVPLPVQQLRTTPTPVELPNDEEIAAFFAPVEPEGVPPTPDLPRFDRRCQLMATDAVFAPAARHAEPSQLGLDFSGPDHSAIRPYDPEAPFALAIGRVRAAQVGEALASGTSRTLVDGTEFVPPVAKILPLPLRDSAYAQHRS